MAIYKNDNGTWYVMIRYQDWTEPDEKTENENRKTAFANVSENDTWTIKHYF